MENQSLEIKCSLCHCNYDNRQKKPMTLKCGHTLCDHCCKNSRTRKCTVNDCGQNLESERKENHSMISVINNRAKIPICSHCTNEFDDDFRKAMVLPCGHSFCKICTDGFSNIIDKCPYNVQSRTFLFFNETITCEQQFRQKEIVNNFSLNELINEKIENEILPLIREFDCKILKTFEKFRNEPHQMLTHNLKQEIIKTKSSLCNSVNLINELEKGTDFDVKDRQTIVLAKSVNAKLEELKTLTTEYWKNNEYTDKGKADFSEIISKMLCTTTRHDFDKYVHMLWQNMEKLIHKTKNKKRACPNLKETEEKSDNTILDILEAVLKDTHKFELAEIRIGVIGQTSHGKSSLINCFTRFVEDQNNEWAPTGQQVMTTDCLYYQWNVQINNKKLPILFIDFPGETVEIEDKYKTLIERQKCDFFIICSINELTSDTKVKTFRGYIEEYYKKQNIENREIIYVRTFGDIYFVSEYESVYESDPNESTDEEKIQIIRSYKIKLDLTCFKDYFIVNTNSDPGRIGRLEFDFEDGIGLKQRIYEISYKLAYPKTKIKISNEIKTSIKGSKGWLKTYLFKEWIILRLLKKAIFVQYKNQLCISKEIKNVFEDLSFNDEFREKLMRNWEDRTHLLHEPKSFVLKAFITDDMRIVKNDAIDCKTNDSFISEIDYIYDVMARIFEEIIFKKFPNF